MDKKNIIITILIALVVQVAAFFGLRSLTPTNTGGPLDLQVKEVSIDKTDYAKDKLGTEQKELSSDMKDLLYYHGRMEKIEKGILIAPDVEIPPCDDSIRGLLWFSKSESGDELLLCSLTTDGVVWRKI